MFTFALAFFFDSFLFIFILFQLFAERGRRNLEESIHNENYWPQVIHMCQACQACQIDRFACFAAYFWSFPKANAFQNLEENLWTINRKTEFPDLSRTLTIAKIFPDFSLTLKNFRFSLTVATLALDSRTRTTTTTRFDWIFYRVFSKTRHPRKLHWTCASPETLALLSLLKEIKPSSDRKMIKRVTFDNSSATTTFTLKLIVEWRRSFPAKMIRAHARAMLSVAKISYS